MSTSASRSPSVFFFLLILQKVEGALLELSKKQDELEKREKGLEGTRKAMTDVTPDPAAAEGNASRASLSSPEVTAPTADNGALVVVPATDNERAPDPGEGAAGNGTAGGGGGAGREWVEYWDESAGASYYFNTVTQVIIGQRLGFCDTMISYLCCSVRCPVVSSVATRPRLDDEASVARDRLPMADSSAISLLATVLRGLRAGGELAKPLCRWLESCRPSPYLEQQRCPVRSKRCMDPQQTCISRWGWL